MERYVLDCSVAFKWFVPEPLSSEAEDILLRSEAGTIALIAPDSIVAEFGHALRKSVLGGSFSAEEALADFGEFLDMPIERIPIGDFAIRALRLATAHMATFYDALYIALAEREGLKVLTADDRMANAFASLDRTVRLADFASPRAADATGQTAKAERGLPAEPEPSSSKDLPRRDEPTEP